MPEWEQRLRQSRTRDEAKPSGFCLIFSDFHDLVFFACGQSVYAFDLGFGDLLQAGGAALGVRLGDLALLLPLGAPVPLVPAHVAGGPPPVLRLASNPLPLFASARPPARRRRPPAD